MVRLREGVSCERVGDSWLVLSDRDGVVHNLTGPAAAVIDCVTNGQPIPPECDDAVASLVDTGILTAPTGWSRRKVLAAGGAAAAIGMVTLTLPTAAMAGSVGPFGTVTATADSNEVTIDWNAAASTSYQVVYKRSDADDTNYVDFGGSVAAGPVVVTGLTNGIGYSFKVQIVGSSPLTESSVVTATPSATTITNLGATWTAVTPVAGVPETNSWRSVAYGNGVWVAVASNGDKRVMRSPDGQTWTPVAAAEANQWSSVATDGNGVWVAVAEEGDNRVMYSTNNGATWTNEEVTGVPANVWRSVAYGNGVWVAVAISGDNRVMRSTDNGETWTALGALAGVTANNWRSVAYGNGVWVAVAINGTNQVMRSTDNGQTWTPVAAAEANQWSSVATGNGIWVAVSQSGDNRVMRSTDNGQTWTPVAAAQVHSWNSVGYGNGVWVAVAGPSARSGPDRAMFSTNDGDSWTAASGVAQKSWNSVAYGNGKFVAVANEENPVMYSPAPVP